MLSTIFASVLAAVAAAAPIAAPAAFTSPYPSAAHTLILHLTHGGCLNWGVTATDGVGSQYNGAPVVLGGCFSGDPWYNAFYIHRGNGQIVAQMQPNLCLDAGENPGNGSKVKLWKCYSGLKQQQWYYTNDNRIALTGTGLCLDNPNGSNPVGQQLQVWACGNGNLNQVFQALNV